MSTELETEKRIPPSLKGTIYQIFLEAISEEIKLFREQARQQKTSFYDTTSMEKVLPVNSVAKSFESKKALEPVRYM